MSFQSNNATGVHLNVRQLVTAINIQVLYRFQFVISFSSQYEICINIPYPEPLNIPNNCSQLKSVYSKVLFKFQEQISLQAE